MKRTVSSGNGLFDLIRDGDRTELDKLLEEVTTDWHAMSEKCQTRLACIDKVIGDTNLYNDQLMVTLSALVVY